MTEKPTSLRSELKRRLGELVDAQFSEEDLQEINSRIGEFDWLIAGTAKHFVRVKKNAGLKAAK